MKTILVMAVTLALLTGLCANSQVTPSLQLDPSVAWGKPVDGLVVGISCDTSVTNSRSLSNISFYVANVGDHDIGNIIQGDERCILIVNGQNYAQYGQRSGGKSTWIPPGRKYGPIPIDTRKYRRIPETTASPTLQDLDNAPIPSLKAGTNNVSVYYIRGFKMGDKVVQSGETKIFVK